MRPEGRPRRGGRHRAPGRAGAHRGRTQPACDRSGLRLHLAERAARLVPDGIGLLVRRAQRRVPGRHRLRRRGDRDLPQASRDEAVPHGVRRPAAARAKPHARHAARRVEAGATGRRHAAHRHRRLGGAADAGRVRAVQGVLRVRRLPDHDRRPARAHVRGRTAQARRLRDRPRLQAAPDERLSGEPRRARRVAPGLRHPGDRHGQQLPRKVRSQEDVLRRPDERGARAPVHRRGARHDRRARPVDAPRRRGADRLQGRVRRPLDLRA